LIPACERTEVTSASLPDLFSRNMDICSTCTGYPVKKHGYNTITF